jgi:hypothetical protein
VGIEESSMRFNFSGHHHRRRLPLGEHLRPGHPRPGGSHREGRHGSAGRDQLRRPDLLRPAAEPRSAFILSIDDEEFSRRSRREGHRRTARLRQRDPPRNADIPIFLHGETRTSRHIPNDILRELHGFIHMFEDTPEFVARHIIREAKATSIRCRRRSSAR